MIRSASRLVAVAAAASLVLAALPALVRADDMDLALSRLRLGDFCDEAEPSLPSWATRCKDQEMFERLVSEYAVALAPPSAGPARSLGARGFQLTLDMTVTGIEAGAKYWVRGTEGSQRLQTGASFGQNPAPSPVLIWNRLQVRKGLPFGFEAGASLGQGIDTSMWTMGLMLKWALFEGFRTHLGRLPDVAVQGGYSRSVGSSQAIMQLATIDLSLSKPFVVEHSWTVSPLAGVQTLFVDVRSGVVDLTPGGLPGDMSPPAEDAFAACAPRAPSAGTKSEPPDVAPNGQPCAEKGGGADFAYSVVFDPVTQTRVRAFGGAQLRYDMFLLQLIMHYDLAAPGVAASGRHWGDDHVPRQLAFNVAFGAVL
jgi:hypothetical protein